MTDSFYEQLQKGCRGLDIELTEKKCEVLYRYYEAVTEKNREMNLTAITGESDFVNKHLIDSLSAVKAAEFRKAVETGGCLIDVGTGAGLPGIVLKTAFPHLDITLMDSLKKRLVFLEGFIESEKISGIRTLHGRAEDVGQSRLRESFDIVTSRAVAAMPVLAEYCLPLVKKGGILTSYKTEGAVEEIKAAAHAVKLLGGHGTDCTDILLPGTDIARKIVVIIKTSATPVRFPRKAGTPAKEPIK